MSSLSRKSYKDKNIFRNQLEKFAQEQINEFINPNPIDLQNDSFITKDEEYYKMYWEDVQNGLFDDTYDNEEDIYDIEDYDPRDDLDYSDERDYEYDIGMIKNIWPMNYYTIGTYYKDEKDRTFLCCQIGNEKRLINIHTGKEIESTFNPRSLTKVG